MRYVKSVELKELDGLGVGIVKFTETMEVLSSAVLNGGITEADALFIMQVPHDYDCSDPMKDIIRVRDAFGLPENSVGMMTAAEVQYVFNVKEAEYGGSNACAIVTAGLSNQVVAGEPLVDWESAHKISLKRAAKMMAGTINIAVVVETPLSYEGKVNLFIPLVEAKSAAMADRGYRETGTTSDSMAVICPKGDERGSYAGTGSSIGISAAKAVREAVGYSLEIRGEHPVPAEPMKLLEKLGYGIDVMWALSGSPMGKEEYSRALDSYLKGDGMKTFLDMAAFSADRADSLAEDGNQFIHPMVCRICSSLIGIEPNLSEGIMQGIIEAIAVDAGRIR